MHGGGRRNGSAVGDARHGAHCSPSSQPGQGTSEPCHPVAAPGARSKAGRNTGGETPRRGGPKEAPGSSSTSTWTLSSVHMRVGMVMSAEKLLIFRDN